MVTSPVTITPRSSTRLISSASAISCSSAGSVVVSSLILVHEAIGGPRPGETNLQPERLQLPGAGAHRLRQGGLRVTGDQDPSVIWPEFVNQLPDPGNITLIRNKIDLSGEPAGMQTEIPTCIGLSAATGEGLDALKNHLKQIMGFQGAGESGFTARRRHLDALERTQQLLANGWDQLHSHAAGELLAEDLRQAQHALGEITGQFTPDDLLGRIFSSFCIGK
jgi:uncharacterized protein YoaH (UPF0181 family)